MKTRRLLLMILAIVATSCARATIQVTSTPEQKANVAQLQVLPTAAVHFTATPEPGLALARFRSTYFSLDISGAGWLLQAAKEGLSFRVVGIYAISQDVAFVFGSFTAMSGGDDVRSVLFRTEDGGKNWQEVMPSFTFSEVTHVLFVQDGIGWASIALTAEGLAGTSFWRTADYGNSWQKIPNVATGLGEDVLGIRFFDSLHGQMKFFDGTGNPNTDGLVIETTKDGGYTWEESLRVHTPGIMHPEEIIASYADADGGRYGSHWGSCQWTIADGCKAFGGDGSAWNIQLDKGNRYYILHSQLLDATGMSNYRVPMDFKYEGGNLTMP